MQIYLFLVSGRIITLNIKNKSSRKIDKIIDFLRAVLSDEYKYGTCMLGLHVNVHVGSIQLY